MGNNYNTKYKVGDKVRLINNYVVTIEDIDSDDFNTTSSSLEGSGLYNLNYFVRCKNGVSIYISLRDIKDIELDLLTEEEKTYIYNIVKPFKKDKHCTTIKIKKRLSDFTNREHISICLYDKDEDYITSVDLPYFENGKYYKGLEVEKYYNVEELGM